MNINTAIKLAICDDNKHFINSMRLELMDNKEIELVGTSYFACDCPGMLEAAKPDILLLDIQMETPTAGISLLPIIKRQFPEVKIIMLTVSEIDDDIFNAISGGADNYVLKDISNADILAKVSDTFNGEYIIDNNILQKYFQRSKVESDNYKSLLYLITLISTLTKSELEILQSIYFGKSYVQIANERYTTDGTVRTITSHIVKKLKAGTIKNLTEQIGKTGLFEKFDDILKNMH